MSRHDAQSSSSSSSHQTKVSGEPEKPSAEERQDPVSAEKAEKKERPEKPAAKANPQQASPRKSLDGQWQIPARYKVKQIIGTGSYGSVAEAWDTQEKRLVAIKRMQHIFMDLVDCKRILREISILSKLRHDHIVRIYDIPVPKPRSRGLFDELYLVMEICDSDLKKLMRKDISLTRIQIDTLLYNILVGMKYLHSASIYHRDLKPANILVNQDCSVKICDFGLARGVAIEEPVEAAGSRLGSRPKRSLTGHVVSRWYRAPELILLQEGYTEAVDVWSLGCIYAELLGMLEGTPSADRGPLFPGSTCFPLSPDHKHKADYKFHTRGQLDQLNMIFNLLGTPCDREIECLERADSKQYIRCFQKRAGKGLRSRFARASEEALDILGQLLRFSPMERITVREALHHELFVDIRNPSKERAASRQISLEFEKEPELDEDLLRKYLLKEIAKYNSQAA